MINNLYRFILILLFIILPVTPAISASSNSFQYYIDLAQQEIDAENYRQAFFYLETAHLIDPNSELPQVKLKNIPVNYSGNKSFDLYFKQALDAYTNHNYESALFYFNVAYQIEPSRDEPPHYINLIRRMQQGHVTSINVSKSFDIVKKKEDIDYERRKQKYYSIQNKKYIDIEKNEVELKSIIKELHDEVLLEKEASREAKAKKTTFRRSILEESIRPSPITVRSATTSNKKTKLSKESQAETKPTSSQTTNSKLKTLLSDIDDEAIIVLNKEMIGRSSNLNIELEMKKSIIIEAEQIRNYIITFEKFIEVKEISSDQLRLTAKRRGSTILHIWDAHGRWTLNVNIILPKRPKLLDSELSKSAKEFHMEPFRFTTAIEWSTFYRGDSIPNLKKDDLKLSQFYSLQGDTPYGHFDGFLNYFKFAESIELVGQGIGLSDGKIGPFKDFSIRGYDTNKRFSSLTLPGRHFRGGLFEAYAFHRKLKYTVLKGQDRASVFLVTPGRFNIKRSFIEGAKATLNPDTDHRYSFNYIRAYGEAKPIEIKNKAFSVDTYNKFNHYEIESEMAFDEDEFASFINTKYSKNDYEIRLNVRDINKNFSTIVGRPTARGEIGGDLSFKWKPEKFNFSSALHIYQNLNIPNPEDEDAINYTVSSSLGLPLNESTHWVGSIGFENTPQLVSPRKVFRINNNINKTIKVFNNRHMYLSLGGSYQTSRFKFSPSSDFDRYSLRTGFRINLLRDLSYFVYYSYSVLKDIEAGSKSKPFSLNTGTSYAKRISDKLTGDISFTYRNEGGSGDNLSFLAGEDSIIGRVGLTYRPSKDKELFVDLRMRNLWAADPSRPDFNDGELRIGYRSTWDTLFRWDPKGIIEGVVYKDIDGNGLQNNDEPGIEGIKVNVGDEHIITNEKGKYHFPVRAKSLKINLDPVSIPSGYIHTTALKRDITIEHRKTTTVNFGLTTRSGLHGVIYVDNNENGKLDTEDDFISKVKIILDDKNVNFSDPAGSYFFENISPGKHKLKIDVNSIPINYRPLIPIENSVTIEEGMTFIFNIPLKRQTK